ncbi:MAG: chloride channel protein, partial [Chloroflexota bacterium]|nr:chloride channel protein [Chloroflexota bacterium]
MKLHERITSWLQRSLSWLTSSEAATGIVVSTVVGIAAGLGAVAFRWLIENFETLFFDGGAQLFADLGRYYIILIPAIGGLLVGLIVHFFAREAKGHGVPEVMSA